MTVPFSTTLVGLMHLLMESRSVSPAATVACAVNGVVRPLPVMEAVSVSYTHLAYRGSLLQDKELMRIFEMTYGPIKRRSGEALHTPKPTGNSGTTAPAGCSPPCAVPARCV